MFINFMIVERSCDLPADGVLTLWVTGSRFFRWFSHSKMNSALWCSPS